MLHTISMKTLVAPLAAICLFTSVYPAVAATTGTANWIWVSPSGSGFAAKFPGAVDASSKVLNTESGSLTAHSYLHDGGSETYLVMYGDNPASKEAGLTLNDVRKGVVGDDGVLISDVNNTVNGYPGKRIIVMKGGHFHADQIVVVGRRIYQALYSTGNPIAGVPNATAFLNSFEVVRR